MPPSSQSATATLLLPQPSTLAHTHHTGAQGHNGGHACAQGGPPGCSIRQPVQDHTDREPDRYHSVSHPSGSRQPCLPWLAGGVAWAPVQWCRVTATSRRSRWAPCLRASFLFTPVARVVGCSQLHVGQPEVCGGPGIAAGVPTGMGRAAGHHRDAGRERHRGDEAHERQTGGRGVWATGMGPTATADACSKVAAKACDPPNATFCRALIVVRSTRRRSAQWRWWTQRGRSSATFP